MIRRSLTYLMFSVLFLWNGQTASAAVTDPVGNVIDQANTLISEAGTVQSDFTAALGGKIKGKVGALGDTEKLAKQTKKVKRAQKRMAKLKAQAERLKKMKDDVTGFAADTMKKYEEAKAYAAEQQGKLEEMRSKMEKAKSEGLGVLSDIEEMKNDVQSGIDTAQDVASAGKEMAESKLPSARSGDETGEDVPPVVSETPSGRTTFAAGTSDNVTIRSGVSTADSLDNITPYDFGANTVTELPTAAVEEIKPDVAGQIAGMAAENISSEMPLPPEELPVLDTTGLNAEEIKKLAAEKASAEPTEEDPGEKTEMSFEEQLFNLDNANALEEKLQSLDQAKLDELKPSDVDSEEFRSGLAAKDKEKLESLESSDYGWEELQGDLAEKDKQKLETLSRSSSRREFGRNGSN